MSFSCVFVIDHWFVLSGFEVFPLIVNRPIFRIPNLPEIHLMTTETANHRITTTYRSALYTSWRAYAPIRKSLRMCCLVLISELHFLHINFPSFSPQFVHINTRRLLYVSHRLAAITGSTVICVMPKPVNRNQCGE